MRNPEPKPKIMIQSNIQLLLPEVSDLNTVNLAETQDPYEGGVLNEGGGVNNNLQPKTAIPQNLGIFRRTLDTFGVPRSLGLNSPLPNLNSGGTITGSGSGLNSTTVFYPQLMDWFIRYGDVPGIPPRQRLFYLCTLPAFVCPNFEQLGSNLNPNGISVSSQLISPRTFFDPETFYRLSSGDMQFSGGSVSLTAQNFRFRL